MTETPAAEAPAAAPAGDARDRRAFVAPLLSTLLTLPMAFVSLVYAMLSPMACGNCNGEPARAFHRSFETAWTVFWPGLVLVLVLLVVCWALPWKVRNSARRVKLALAAPGLVLLGWLVFMAMVDWP
ncbi:hypothetical protein ACFY7H_19550 [Streptomyces sp. NPDC012794]|uniref:hypothetical protein n=1 Tax=Streptomyces sp. NPDC012794 TaxID=3364850 RepID=UPI00369A984B